MLWLRVGGFFADPEDGPEYLHHTIELAGPEAIRMDELVLRFLNAKRDERQVTTDVHALYFGTKVNDQSLTPGNRPRLGPTRFDDWLPSRSMAVAHLGRTIVPPAAHRNQAFGWSSRFRGKPTRN